MDVDLQAVLDALKAHEVELRRLGVQHAGVFGSLVRSEARPGSEIDILIDLDPDRPIGVFGYARLKLNIDNLLGGATDAVNRRKLKLLLRDHILRECLLSP